MAAREARDRDYEGIARNKTKMAAWFVSDCHPPSRREEYVRELQKHMQVDVYGKCGALSCADCLAMLSRDYHFYLAFENSFCHHYVTEKIFKLFVNDVDVIPVVRGALNYSLNFPPRTLVDTADFSSPAHLARYLAHLAADTASYSAMLREKARYRCVSARKRALCHLCQKLHLDVGSAGSYPDLVRWMVEGQCRAPTDLDN